MMSSSPPSAVRSAATCSRRASYPKSLTTVMAISLHHATGRPHGVNPLAVARVTLGTNIADPIVRLKVVQQSSSHAKATIATVGEPVLDYLEFVPGGLVVAALRAGMATHLGIVMEQARIANTVVSSLRGPDFPLYLVGARMQTGYALSPFTQGGGLLHNVISYCGQVTVSINGSPLRLPDIEAHADCLDASFAEDAACRGDLVVTSAPASGCVASAQPISLVRARASSASRM